MESNSVWPKYGHMLLCIIFVCLEDIKHVYNIKMWSPKTIKNPKLIKIMRELKDQENAIEEINRIEGLEIETIKGSTKRKLSVVEKERIDKINELEENLRIKIVKWRMQEKPLSFKMKNK